MEICMGLKFTDSSYLCSPVREIGRLVDLLTKLIELIELTKLIELAISIKLIKWTQLKKHIG